jgi:hypothetical protein
MNQSRGWRRAALLWMASAAIIVQAGCSGSDGGTVVRGLVTMDGKPVTSGGIFFQAAGARPLGGPIGADGNYEYELPPGEYQVRIDAPAPVPANHKDGDPLPQLPRLAPEKFASFSSSGLTATVAAESPQELNFPLK